MKRVFFYLTFVSVILATSCEIIEDADIFEPDQPDHAGNLLIINNSNEQLVLYKDQQVIKKIPASATDFLVNIPNPDEGTVQLDLYLWTDVYDNVNNPDPALAYKRWLVPLSSGTSVTDQVTWHIGTDDTFMDVATVNYSYFGGTSYNVDVFLDNRNGSKIMSLKPGDQYKKVGIDYGNYILHYKYWYSDPNDANAIDEDKTVWVEKETINGNEVNIWMVLNENRKDVTYIIPHNGIDTDKDSWYGSIKISNTNSIPVVISAGDKLIENVCHLESGSKTNYSTLSYGESRTFVMPILTEDPMEETYILTARDLEGRYISDTTITVTPDVTVNWTIK